MLVQFRPALPPLAMAFAGFNRCNNSYKYICRAFLNDNILYSLMDLQWILPRKNHVVKNEFLMFDTYYQF